MILAMRSKSIVHLLPDGQLCRTTDGMVHVSSGHSADIEREKIMPPLLPGFRRVKQWLSLSLDRRTLEAMAVDEEATVPPVSEEP